MPNVSQMSQEKAEKGPNFSKGFSPLGFTSSQILFSAAKFIGHFGRIMLGRVRNTESLDPVPTRWVDNGN